MAVVEQPQWHLNHLLKWLHKFSLQDQPPATASLSDGVVISSVLNLIDQQWFNESWLSKIKPNVGSNKIMKVSNLKKVIERVVDYYEVHLDQRLSGFTMPDVNKIGESEDEVELCRLLQLVLGCAVHCERQAEFIEVILQMEEEVQRGIMAAIQELPGIGEPAGGSLVPNADSLAVMAGRSPNQTGGTAFQNLLAQLEAVNEEKKHLTKERHQLNLQISTLQDEIQHLQAEVESLRSGGAPLESMDGANPSALMQKREIQRLTEELLRSDSAREELRLRCENLEQEIERMRNRLDDLLSAAEQTRSLKDEVDILREKSARLENAQSTIDSMRRKVEEGNELKRQLRKLEEKNSQYIQQNMELEEEVKKLGPWKSQLELQKKQIAEFQQVLDEERRRADRFELQYKNLLERNETLTQEKERLVVEREKLIELNEEIKFAQLSNGTTATTLMLGGSPSATGVDTLDMIPPEIKEKLLRLEHENRMLKEKKHNDQSQDEVEVLKTVNAGLNERIERLETENRKSIKRVMELEIQLENTRVASPISSGADGQSDKDSAALKIRIKSLERELQQKKLDSERLETRLAEQVDKAKIAQETLKSRDREMQVMEERYKQYIAKAKAVLQTLDPKHNPNLSASSPEVAALQVQLKEKDRLIERLEAETERHKVLRETEEHLVTTAFYNLGMQLQRQAMEQRLGTANAVQGQAGAPPVPQSFLARQRQASVRGKSSSINPQGETYN